VKKRERPNITGATQRINLIYKNDRRLLFTSHLEHLLDKTRNEFEEADRTEHSLPATWTPDPKKKQT
jgi:hypothetical protein